MFIFLKKLNITRQTFYLSVIALADNLSIISYGALWMVPAKGLPWISNGHISFFTINQGGFWCILHRFINILTNQFACTAILICAIDRCLTIYFPLSFSKKTLRFSIKVVLATILVDITMSSPYLYYGGYSVLNTGQLLCWMKDPIIYFWKDIWFGFIVGNCVLTITVLLLIVNALLCYRIIQEKKAKES